MPDIIDQIRDAMSEKQLANLYYTLIPRLIRMHDEGLIPVLPCKVGATVYTIEENCFDCEHCPFGSEAHLDKEINQVCCDREKQHCPYSIEEHTVEGFEISGKDGKCVISDPGEWGYEGLEHFSGIDNRCHYSREAAENALKERE